MNRAMPTITERAAALTGLLKAETNVKRAQRLQMLYRLASKQTKTPKEVAAVLGVHRHTVGDWLTRSAAGGREALLERSVAPGTAPRATPEVEAQLRAQRSKPAGCPASGAMAEWLWQNHGIKLAYATVPTLLRSKRKARPNVPRRSNRKKPPRPSSASPPKSSSA